MPTDCRKCCCSLEIGKVCFEKSLHALLRSHVHKIRPLTLSNPAPLIHRKCSHGYYSVVPVRQVCWLRSWQKKSVQRFSCTWADTSAIVFRYFFEIAEDYFCLWMCFKNEYCMKADEEGGACVDANVCWRCILWWYILHTFRLCL